MNALGIAYFYVCAMLAVIGALSTVIAKNPIRGAMGLLLMILSIAGLFLALHAEFLAFIQLIVYAGAIVILFLFVIMLLGPNATAAHDSRGIITRALGGTLFALIAAAGLFAVGMTHPATAKLTEPTADFGGINAFGQQLFTTGIVPFELSSALLLVAVLGALAIAKGSPGKATAKSAAPAKSFARPHATTEHVGDTAQ